MDGSGGPIADGNHTIVIKLYNSTGTQLFTESHVVPVVRGTFNIIIGSVTALPPAIQFNEQYMLGISVDGGVELSPRTALTSSPYAMRAAMADQAAALAPGATGVVTSLNGASGEITLQGGGGTTINRSGNTISISSTGGGGGGGIAGVQNSDGSITVTEPNGPVANLSVAENGITSTKIADGSITTADIADGAVTSTKIADGSVSTLDIADGAVNSSKIADGGVSSADIADDAVTSGKIANSAVTLPKLSTAGAASGNVLSYNGTSVVWASPSASGLTLPYTGTLSSTSTAFGITASGTGGVAAFRNTNASPTESAVLGTVTATSPSLLVAGVEGRSTNGFGVIGTGGAGSTAIYGAVITTPTAGAFLAGTGVSGFSDVSNGVAGNTYSATGNGVYGIANGNGNGVRGASNTGRAGIFEITNSANTSNALEGITPGSGIGVRGFSNAATGSTTGVLGEASSTTHGIGAAGGVSGVLGRINATSPGGYSAGVRGLNNSTAGTGIGVIGYQAGSGWGVYGETPSGFGVYGLVTNNTAVSVGVRGETFSTNGTGVEAKYSGTGAGTALEIDNGAIKVAGVNKAAFVHTATVANKLSANGTDIDNPLCNGDATAILFVTAKMTTPGLIYNNSPIGVVYNSVRAKWEIFNQNVTAIPTGALFNVLVIKQ